MYMHSCNIGVACLYIVFAVPADVALGVAWLYISLVVPLDDQSLLTMYPIFTD